MMTTTLNDDELLKAFESTDLPVATFSHAMHVRVAWCYLRRDPFPIALGRFATALKAYATAKSVPGLYHETVTVAWMTLINERLDGAQHLAWEAFMAAFPELFAKPSLLLRYYSEETLKTARARRMFVLPERIPALPR